jgi:hypothetical protein
MPAARWGGRLLRPRDLRFLVLEYEWSEFGEVAQPDHPRESAGRFDAGMLNSLGLEPFAELAVGANQATGADLSDKSGRGGKRGGCTGRMRDNCGLWGSWERQEMALPCLSMHLALNARLEIEFRATRVYITGRAKTENGNSGLMTRAFNC